MEEEKVPLLKKNGKPEKKTFGSGRPPKAINWDLVDQLLLAGCDGKEISSHFDMHEDTLYIRTAERYNMTFSAYSQSKNSQGKSLLRSKQFQKAMKGDNPMLMFLGKHRLDQWDKPQEITIDAKVETQHEAIMSQISDIQKSIQAERILSTEPTQSDLNINEINTNEEQKS